MSEPVFTTDMLMRFQAIGTAIEAELLSGLLKMRACEKLTVGDVKLIAENARTIAFDKISEGMKP